jgi:CMP-N,N'-diacetyllegionaminic acid synthase
MRVLGIIPARGGSKGVRRKNLARVGGRSLVRHAVAAAIGSGVLDRVVVDSDDEEIMDEARACGAEVLYKRPEDLATDDAKTADVVRHLLGWLERDRSYDPDAIALIEPTCPLRSAEDIAGAYRAFQSSGRPCLLTVSPPMQHPGDFIRFSSDGWAYCMERPPQHRGRQDFAPCWFINGALYITRTNFFLQFGRFYDLAQSEVFVMPVERSFDIDTPFDLALAQAYVAFIEARKED